MAIYKDANPYTVSATSSTVYAFQNLNINTNAKTEDLPSIVIISNASASLAVDVKLMDKTEGDGASRTGTTILPGNTMMFQIEKDELPVYRVGAKLTTGSGSATVYVNSIKYKTWRV